MNFTIRFFFQSLILISVLICTCTLFLNTQNCSAQTVDSITSTDSSFYIVYIPKHSWSIGAEYSFIINQFSESSFVPDNYEVQWWIHNRLYLQTGAFAQYGSSSFDNYFFNYGWGVYAGATAKLFLFKNGYFTPSWNIYYDQTPKDYDIPGWSIATGPTASLEYFIKNRISFRLDLINFNFGYFFADDGSNSSSHVSFHRFIGLGARYNFDLRKQK